MIGLSQPFLNSYPQQQLDVEDQEPSLSTLLVNIDSEFDPYGAMSTPLYQTATFKQISLLNLQRRKTGPMIILEVEILHEILWKDLILDFPFFA
ncbi:hypothetical protein V6N11_055412 [Hibiscus sabdariffa]|uniref:Uncharacterized protein n=1 Tax=Hibiscus sabdariffa TaxID=183260 RepID=A0ABR2PFB8_9ROSI